MLHTLKKFFTQSDQSRADLVDPYVVVSFAGAEVSKQLERITLLNNELELFDFRIIISEYE